MRVKWNRNLDVPVPQRAQTTANTDKYEKRRSFFQLFKFRDKKDDKSNKDDEKSSTISPSKTTTKVRKTVTFAETSKPQIVMCNRKGRRVETDQVDMSVFKVISSSESSKSSIQDSKESPLFKKRPESESCKSVAAHKAVYNRYDSQKEMCAGKILKSSGDRFTFRKDRTGIMSSWDSYKPNNMSSNSSASQTRITSNGLKIHTDFKVDNDEINSKLVAQEEGLKVSRIPVAVGAIKGENYYGYNGKDRKNVDYSENEYLNYQCKQEKRERITQSKLSTVGKADEKFYPDKIGNDRAMSKVILTHKNARSESVKKKTFTEVEKICDIVPFGRTCSIPKVIPTDVLKLYNYDSSNNDSNEKTSLIEIDEKSNVEKNVNDKACKKSCLSKVLDNNDKNITRYGIFPSTSDFHAEPVFIDDDDVTTDDFCAGIDNVAQNIFCSAENSKKLLMKTECSSLRSATNIASSNDLGGCQGQIKFACFSETAGATEKESSDEMKRWINSTIDLNSKIQDSRKFSFETTNAFVKDRENNCWMETCVSSQLIPPTAKLKAEHVFIDDDDEVEIDQNIIKISEKTSSEVNVPFLQPDSSLKKLCKNSEPNESMGIVCDVSDLVSNSSKSRSFDDGIFSDDTKEFSVKISKNRDSFSEVIEPVDEVLFIDDEPKLMETNTSKNLDTKLVCQQKSADNQTVILQLPIAEDYTKQTEEISKNKNVQKLSQEYVKEVKCISKNHYKQTEHAFEDYPKQLSPAGFTVGSSIMNEKIEDNQKDLLSSFKLNDVLLVENNQIDRDNTGHTNNLLVINKTNEEEINNNCEISEESNVKHTFAVYDKTISLPTNIARSENILKNKQNLTDDHSINIDTQAELVAEFSPEKLVISDLKTKLLIDDVSEIKTNQNFTRHKKQDLNFMNLQGIITRNLSNKDNSVFKVVDTETSEIDTIEVSLCKNLDEENTHGKETCSSVDGLNTGIIECATIYQLTSQNLKDRDLTSSVTSKSSKCELDDITDDSQFAISVYNSCTFKDNNNVQDFINQKSNESGQFFQCKNLFSNWKNLILPIQITLNCTINPLDFLMKENNGRKLIMDNDIYRNPVVIASENSSLCTRIPNVWEESGSQDKNSPEIGYMKLTGLDGGRLLVQLNRLFRDVNERPVKFEELVQCQQSKSLDILSLLYAKHAKQPQLSIKGNVQNSKQQPPVWTTRVELAKEIQRLGTLCEARTKELTHLKMQLKHASLGFDTFVVLFQYLTEELDAFSHTHLVSELERTKEALIRAEEQLQQYKNEFEELKVKHSTEFSELTDKLNRTYQEVIEELTCKYTTEIQELKCLHEQQLAEMSENHMKQYQEAKERHTMSLIDLETSHQQQIQDMKKTHAEELEEIEYNHQQARLLLRNQLKELEHQCKDLKHQAKLVEEALQRDTDTKIQWISVKKADLEKEVDSLKTVLDMKRNEIHALRKENLEMKKELEKLPVAKEKIKMLQAKAEDLQAMVDEKVQKERQLSCDHESLKESYEKESKVNKRLSMENEELLWKLKQTAEANFLNSLSGSPEVFEKLFSPLKSPNKQSVSLPPMFFHSIDESFASAKETISPNTSNSKNGCKKPPLSPRKCSSPVRTPSFVAASPAAPCSRRCKTETKSPRKQKQKFQNTNKNKSLTENLTSDSTNSDESIIGAKSTPDRDVNYASMVQNGIHDDGGEIYSCSLEKARDCDELMFQQNKESSDYKLLDFENFNEQEKPRAFKFELENLTTGSISSNNGHFPLTYCQQMISSFSEEESSNSSSSKNFFLFDENHFGEKGPFDFNHSLIQREGWAISSPRNHAGEAMVHNLSQVSDESGQFGTSTGQTTKVKSTHLQENEQNGHHLESFTMDMPDSNNLDTSCEDLLSEPEQIS